MDINLIAGVLLMILIYSVCVGVVTERTEAFFESEYSGIAYRACRSGMASTVRALSSLCGLVRQAARSGVIF
jgi:hypothetical protein